MSMVCDATDNYKHGDQVFIMYGKRTNAEALLHNGFIYKENENDAVWITMGLSDSDELREERTTLFKKLNITVPAQVNLLPEPTFISPEMLAFARIFNMNRGDYTFVWVDNMPSLSINYRPNHPLDR